MKVSEADYNRLVAAIGELHGATDFESLPLRVIDTILRLVPADIVSYNVVDIERNAYHFLVHPPDAFPQGLEPIFVRHLREHPILAYQEAHQTGKATRLSDVTDQVRFHRTALYNEFFRQIHVEYQVAIAIMGSGLVQGVALSRRLDDFNETELFLLDSIRPHWALAHKNTATLTIYSQVAAIGGRDILSVSRTGHLVSASDSAIQRLVGHFGHGELAEGRLPDELYQWTKQQSLNINDDIEISMAQAQVLELNRDNETLVLRFIPGGSMSDHDIIIMETVGPRPDVQSVSGLNLTPRQAEVLALVQHGNSNREIGETLMISPRTVQTHLENIYERLGVNSRAAAVARSFQLGNMTAPQRERLRDNGWKAYSLETMTQM